MDRKALQTVNSDEWWFDRLSKRMVERKKRRDGTTRSRTDWYDILWSWFEGDPPLPEHSDGWQQQVTRDVLRMGRANFAQLGVVSLLDRVKLGGIRPVDSSVAGSDTDPNSIASRTRRLMKQYGKEFNLAELHAAVMGEGYLWVGGVNPLTGLPVVTAEDPRQCVTIADPNDPNREIAALKIFTNDLDGYDYAVVAIATYRDEVDENDQPVRIGSRIRVARRKTGTFNTSRVNIESWEWHDEAGSGLFPMQGRGVFVHRLAAPLGMGDFEGNLDLLARINNMIVDRLWISKFQVFRQRAFERAENGADDDEGFPEEDDDGNPINWDEVLSADPGAVWLLPAGYKIWESTPTDLSAALTACRDDIKEYAATNRTPLYVFTPDAVGGSAEGASLAREQQVYKAESWMDAAALPILSTVADVLAILESDPLFNVELEAQWKPAERFSLIQRTQAAAAAKAAGVPWEGRMEDYLQLPPETVARYRRQRRADLLFESTLPAGTEPSDGSDASAAS